MTATGSYVLLSAAKNEERHIALTIESVLKQSTQPLLWVITDDGSSDHTAAIVEGYSRRHSFIRLQRNCVGAARSFGAQYRALVAAYDQVRDLEFDYVGMLDADIELPDPNYFAHLIAAFRADPTLGITGGYIHEPENGQWRSRRSNSPHSVAGAVQLFRRRCYQDIDGYHPLIFGGEDWLAQIDAAAAGWSVRSQTELPVRHHRPTSSADGQFRGLFRLGMRDASFGSHPLFELAKCARRTLDSPPFVGSMVRLAGFCWYGLSVRNPTLPADKVRRLRREQVSRLQFWVTSPAAQA
jgi:glycosyltransferase involved in cell wall biosynthesis